MSGQHVRMGREQGAPAAIARALLDDIRSVVGARHVIARYPEAVSEVPLTDIAALVDVDTPEALVRVRAELEGA